MDFRATRQHPELAETAARAVGLVDWEFTDGLPKPSWVDEYPQTSASYICSQQADDLIALGKLARDPRRVDQMPHLSQLTVSIDRNAATMDHKLHIYLSQQALTDRDGRFLSAGGSVRSDVLESLLSFPELSSRADEFTFPNLHPGRYFLTVVADLNGDGFPSPGDITHPLRTVEVEPESHARVRVDDLAVRN